MVKYFEKELNGIVNTNLQGFDGQSLHFGCIPLGLTFLLFELPATLLLGILIGQNAFLLLLALILAPLGGSFGASGMCALQKLFLHPLAILVRLGFALKYE